MKFTRQLLLATVGVSAMSTAASADELADLKAQIEALNSRISQLEAAPSVPSGYQLLTVSEGPAIVVPSLTERSGLYNSTATTIGILPAADAPASTNIQWSGFARAALVYWSGDVDEAAAGGSEDSTDVLSRGELKVVGTTDTSVGEVGVLVKLRADFEGFRDMGFGQKSDGNKSDVYMNEAWGWWQLTPEMALGGGFTGTLANIGYGVDGSCNCYTTDNAPIWLNPGDRTQMRLSYASGPLAMAIAIEDSSFYDPLLGPPLGEASDTLGVTSEAKWTGDSFAAELSGGWWDGGRDRRDAYQIGVGGLFALGDMASISLGAGFGESSSLTTDPANNYWKASILASANLSDSIKAEIGYGFASFDRLSLSGFGYYGDTGTHFDANVHSVLAGVYYEPVSQLTIGLEGEWQAWDSKDAAGLDKDLEIFSAGLVSIFRF